MKLSTFKKQLKNIGISYTMVEERFREDGPSRTTLEEVIKNCKEFSNIIQRAFVWVDTPEGYTFWWKVADSNGLVKLCIAGNTVFTIGTKGLEIDGKAVPKKEALLLFKFLAEYLNYEVED